MTRPEFIPPPLARQLSQASDEGNRFDEATVKINITDANTHRPHFDQSLYNVKVSEDDPPGTLIYTALATGKRRRPASSDL